MTQIYLASEIRLGYDVTVNEATLTINGLEDVSVVSVEVFRNILNVDFDYNCWIKPPTEECWLRIPDDRLLKFLFSTYYVNSKSISIVFRPKGQSSPNTSFSVS